MKKIILGIIAFAILGFALALPTADEIIQKAEDRMKGKTSFSEATVTTIRKRYTREMKIKTWSKGDDYSVTLVLSPAKDKGTVFLKRKNEMWNYIPSIDRLVKMPPSMLSQSWMGTDIKNDDLLENSSMKEDYNKTIVGNETIEGLDCYKIEMKPKKEVNSIWGKVDIWISKVNFMQMKIQYYDEDMELVNTFFGKKVTTINKLKMPAVMEIVPANKKGNKTKMTTTNRELNVKIDDNIFTTQYMKRLK